MEGWVKVHRAILNWEWYKDANTLRLFIHLLLKANHKPGKFQGVAVNRGQVITGRKVLSVELGISEQSVRTSLNRLKSTSEITIKTTNKNSIITIVNYDLYQIGNDGNQQTNQQLTSNQPATNQQLTTNKNDNNDNNEMNEKKVKDTPLDPILKDKANQWTNNMASFFLINKREQPGPYKAIENFVKHQAKKGDLDFLAKQFTAYQKAKSKDPKFKHSLHTYLGNSRKGYEDGQWNIKDWTTALEGSSIQSDQKIIEALKRTQELLNQK